MKYREKDIQSLLFTSGGVKDKLMLFRMLSFPMIWVVVSGSVSGYMKHDELSYSTYRAILANPLYTRNNKLEVRALLSTYLLLHYLFPQYKSSVENEMIRIVFLIILLDTLADTVADEYESKNVRRLLGKNDTYEKARSLLVLFEESLINCIDGNFASRKELDKFSLNECMLLFQEDFLQLHEKLAVDTVVYEKIMHEIQNGIRYIFDSHKMSLQLHKQKISLITGVDEYIRQTSGGIAYYAVMFCALLAKAGNTEIGQMIQEEKKSMAISQSAIALAELTSLVDGYKSYIREFREGDFSSWVSIFCIAHQYVTRKELEEYIKSGLDQRLFEELYTKINHAQIRGFLIKDVTKRLNHIIRNGSCVINATYVTMLILIMRMQIQAGKKEEQQQMQQFIYNQEAVNETT